MNLNKDFWEHRYDTQQTQWDIGYISTPLKTYIDQLENKELNILIPGAGNGYEALYLHKKGFTNVTVIDIATQPIENLKQKGFPKAHLLQHDFFDVQDVYFDLILEQTFFCALPPSFRSDYAIKMHELLQPEGKLAGVLFDFPLTEMGPPFGGSIMEYQSLFSNYFHFKTLERAYNSIPPRQGNELFFIFEKEYHHDEE